MTVIIFHSKDQIIDFFKYKKLPIKIKAMPFQDNTKYVAVALYFKDNRTKTGIKCYSGEENKSFFINKKILDKKGEIIL